MSVSNELEAGRWIKAMLEADAPDEQKAYLDIIPEIAGLPNFRYQCQRRNDIRTVSQHIAMSTYHFLVVATAQGQTMETGPNGLITLAEYISDTLHRAYGVTSKARILACTRTESYGDTESVGGDVIRHQGAMFEIHVMGLPESE